MNRIKNAATATKNQIIKHRAKIATVATIVVMAKLNRMAQSEQLDFIESEGLTDKYYNAEMEEELAAAV